MNEFPDLSYAFDCIFSYIMYFVTWSQTHGFRLWGFAFTYFDCAIGIAAAFLIVSFIPIFGDPYDDDVEWTDFGGW